MKGGWGGLYTEYWLIEHVIITQGFPCGPAGKESACNAGDLGLISGLGRSPGEGKGYPLQYSGPENFVDCIVHGVTKSQTWLSDFRGHLWARPSTEWASQVVLVVKNPPANAGDARDAGSITGSGKSPGVGNGNLLWYSCLENSMDRGAWSATVMSPRGSKELDTTEWLSTLLLNRSNTCMCAKSLQSYLTLCDPKTVARQAPLAMEFSRQEYWSGLPCLPPGDLPHPVIEPVSLYH